MGIKSKLIGFVGIASLGLAMTSGIAAAQTVASDSATGSVDVTCSAPATVALGGNFAFAPITDSTTQHSTSTGPAAIDVTVNMGCYWGPWTVDAHITNFVAGPLLWFGANHFSMTNASVNSYFLDPLDGPFDIFSPTANDATFGPAPSNAETILETQEVWFLWWQLDDVPAPFVTTASYQGNLTGLPAYLLSGTYSATLTVDLSLD